MKTTFFGQFLLDQGLITQGQLDEAIALQRESNVLLGALAINKGFMTKEQIVDVMQEQHCRHGRFGELARRKNYLTDDQVQELLHAQGSNHVFLGEALTRRNYLDIRELTRQLKRFEEDIRKKEASLQIILESLDDQHVFASICEMSREYLYRLGYTAHVNKVDNILPSKKFDHVFFMTLVDGTTVYYCGFYLTDIMAYQIAYGKLPEATFPTRETFNKDLAGIFYNLNLVICEELNRKGLDVSVGDSGVLPPENVSSWTCLHAETLIETFQVVLGSGPMPGT
jgi:hypothetical protein